MEECDLKGDQKEDCKEEEPKSDENVIVCTDKVAQNHHKELDWKPTLRLRDEAAGLQKQEMEAKFERAMLDRLSSARYW